MSSQKPRPRRSLTFQVARRQPRTGWVRRHPLSYSRWILLYCKGEAGKISTGNSVISNGTSQSRVILIKSLDYAYHPSAIIYGPVSLFTRTVNMKWRPTFPVLWLLVTWISMKYWGWEWIFGKGGTWFLWTYLGEVLNISYSGWEGVWIFNKSSRSSLALANDNSSQSWATGFHTSALLRRLVK